MLFKAVLCGACSDRAKAAWEHIGRLSKRRAIDSVPDIRSAPCRQARVVARTSEVGPGRPMNAFVAMFFRLSSGCQILVPRTGYEAHPMLDWHTCDPLPM